MSTPTITPSPEPQIQTTPTPAGTPPPIPVQPRDESGRFAPVAAPAAPAPQTPPPPAVTAPTPAPVAAPATPQPYTLADLGNGRVKISYETGESFEGTPQEVIAKTAEAHVNTKRWAQQQRTQAPQPVTPTPVAQPANSPFSDPTEEQAANQLLDLTAKGLGYKNGDELRERMGFISQTTEAAAGRDLNIQFHASQPDFNATPENAEKLVQVIATLVPSDDAWGRMPQQQQLNIMRAAHAMAILSKAYDPVPPQATAPAASAPPPIPTNRAPQDQFSGIPPELIPTVNDSQAVILDKIAKLKAGGYSQ